jgi:Flp pilus assembly protein TadB
MLGFFKVKKHENRGFNYQPRFYNKDKEEINTRIKAAEARRENAQDGEAAKLRIRDELRRARTLSRRQHKGLWNGSSVRMLVILIILMGAVYVALNQWLPGLLNFWFPDQSYN